MKQRRYFGWIVVLFLASGLLTASVTAFCLNQYQAEQQFAFINTISNHALTAFGYVLEDFYLDNGLLRTSAIIGFFVGTVLFGLVFWLWKRNTEKQIRELTEYLEKMNTGNGSILLPASESEVSKLQDEIYKTVTSLQKTRDDAMDARNHFAENLSNIAHQLKTPITAISLSVQMLHENDNSAYLLQIQNQLHRLIHLEESLLLLSRIDAGTLTLKREMVDVFTLLTLAAENLQELSAHTNVSLEIPETGEMGEMEEMEEITIHADLDWTMEAVMNLMKNCIEHSTEGNIVHVSYEKNPLYTQIQIWDEGDGFAKEEIPYLFQRFFRGKCAKQGSIGIGLSIAKEIIEMQNGILSAKNLSSGGACFEIRFYCH